MPPTLQEYTLQEGLPRNGSITSKMNFMTRVRYGLQVSGIGCGINMGTKWRSGRHGMIMMWISKPRCRRISAGLRRKNAGGKPATKNILTHLLFTPEQWTVTLIP